MDKPKITISLKPHLADYCRHEFGVDIKCDEITLTRKHDIGKLINSVIIANDVPVRRPFISSPCVFILPLSGITDMRNKFLYVSKWGEQKIQDFIEAEFNMHIKRFFDYGYEKGFSQKRIIEAILAGFNIRNNGISWDSVKKNDYRRRRKIRKQIFNELQSAQY